MSVLKENDFEYTQINASEKSVHEERKGLVLFTLSMIMIGFSNITIKMINSSFPETYDSLSLNFWRALIFIPLGYYLLQRNNEQIIDLRELKNPIWFYFRVGGNFLWIIAFSGATQYLRTGTVQCITSMSPIIVIILSIAILNEKFHFRYLICLIICFIGAVIIIMNDKDDPNAASLSNEGLGLVLLGVLFSIITMICAAFIIISVKMLAINKVSLNNQVFFIGVLTSVFSLACVILNGKFNCEFSFIFYCFLSGLIYYLYLVLNVKSMELVEVMKTTPLTYLASLCVFLMGVIFLGESMYMSDLIGSMLILAPNIYNSLYPIKN